MYQLRNLSQLTIATYARRFCTLIYKIYLAFLFSRCKIALQASSFYSSIIAHVVQQHEKKRRKRILNSLTFILILFTEDGFSAWRRTSIRLRGAFMGGRIWPFSEKLYETGNGAFREYHAIFCELRENRVSELYEV